MESTPATLPKKIHVYGLPELVSPEEIRGQTAVVIDVLRATTTVVAALRNGAARVVPVLEVEEAKKLKSKILDGKDSRFPRLSENDILLGGERKGVRVEGFDCGNSPREYVPEKVAGKTLLFSTTNGTRAMHRARLAQSIYLASFLNIRALVRQLLTENDLHIICAGTDGDFTEEDLYLAGCLVERIQRAASEPYLLNVQGTTVLELWNRLFPVEKILEKEPIDPESLARQLRNTSGGKNVLRIGLDDDILFASRINSVDLLVRLDPKTMIIEPVSSVVVHDVVVHEI